MRTYRLPSILATAFAFVATIAHASTIAVTEITGDVQVTQGGKTSALAKGATLGSGATLATGPTGSASIAFSNGALLSVTSGTVLSIEEYSQRGGAGTVDPSKLTKEPTASRTILNLRKGHLTGEIKQLNLPAGSVFKVKTPAGPLSIKGTIINVDVTETTNGSYTITYSIVEGSGLVEPTTVVSVDLGNGQSITVTIDGDKVTVGDIKNLSPAQIAQANQIVAALKTALGTTTFNTGSAGSTGTITIQTDTDNVTGIQGSGFNR